MKNMKHEQVLAYAEAVKELEEWPAIREAHNADRDRRIRAARDLGISQMEIAERMKIGRNTVRAVLGTDDESSEEG
jgi:ribosome-binding protein aMBF1 (putative translation factor)